MPKKQHIEIEGKQLAISNVDKVFFPGNGFTKGRACQKDCVWVKK